MASKKHGLSQSPIYGRWFNMKDRCYNPSCRGYPNYGGRGITVCDEWKNNLHAFCDYVMSLPNALKDGYTIDRYPNNDEGYKPGNIRWANKHDQLVNQRKGISSSGFTGVYPRVEGTFYSRMMKDGTQIHLGAFKTAVEAATVRDMYIIKNGLWEYPLQVIRKNYCRTN